MGAPTIARSPQASTPPQGGKGGGRPMPAQGGKGGTPMPPQGGKGGRPLPSQGGKAPVPMGGFMGGGYPQRDYGYGNQLPPQGGKGGPSNVPDYMQPYVNALPPQVQQPAPVQQPVNPYADNVAAPQLADTINSLTPKPIQPVAPQVQQPFPGGFPQRDLGYGNQLPPEVQAQINATRSNPQVQKPFPRQFDPRMMRYIQMQQEQQRRQQEMMMRLPPRLRQQYMQQGQQPSNLGLGGLGGLLGGFR